MKKQHEEIIEKVAQETHNAEDVRRKLIRETETLEVTLRTFRARLQEVEAPPAKPVRRQYGKRWWR